jgi:hypothetical protein
MYEDSLFAMHDDQDVYTNSGFLYMFRGDVLKNVAGSFWCQGKFATGKRL